MAMDSHLAELERRHEMLEKQLEEALTHPGVDSLELRDLKRKKLHVKDEIARLSGEHLH